MKPESFRNSGRLMPLIDIEVQRPAELGAADLLAMLKRHWLLILLCTVLTSAAGAALYRLERPTYSSTARILIQTDQLGTPSFLSGIAAYRESQYADPVNRKIETEIALLLSRSNAANAIQSLNLGREDLPASPLAIIGRWLKRQFDQLQGTTDIESGNGPPTKLIDDFLGNINVDAMRSKTAETTSNVLDVKLDSTRRDLATRALRSMLDGYLSLAAQQSKRLGQATIDQLNTQIAQARQELADAEKAIVDLSIQDSSRSELAAAAAAAAAYQGGARRDNAGFANDSTVSQLVNQLVQLQSQLTDQRSNFTDETDSVKKLKQQVADARARLAAHMRASATASAEFARLDRRRALAQDHYSELRKKLEQIELYVDLTPAALNGRVVVDPPSIPGAKEFTKKKLILAASPPAGLLLGLLLAGSIELLFQRVRTRRDAERMLGLPLVGSLPTLSEPALQRAAAIQFEQASSAERVPA